MMRYMYVIPEYMWVWIEIVFHNETEDESKVRLPVRKRRTTASPKDRGEDCLPFPV